MGAAVYGVLVAAQGFGAWAILAAMIVAVPVYAVALAGFGGLTKEDLEDIPFIGAECWQWAGVLVILNKRA